MFVKHTLCGKENIQHIQGATQGLSGYWNVIGGQGGRKVKREPRGLEDIEFSPAYIKCYGILILNINS